MDASAPVTTSPDVDVSGAVESAKSAVKSATAVIGDHVDEAVHKSGLADIGDWITTFWHRLWEDPVRLIICILVTVLVGRVIASANGGRGIKALATVSGGLFTFYWTWHAYSSMFKNDTKLFFDGEPGFSTLAASAYAGGWLLACSIVGFLAGATIAYKAKAGVLKSLLVGVAVWFGVVLIFYLVSLFV